jgi:hypothetical protein
MIWPTVRRWLARPRIHWAGTVLALLRASPALFAGLILDDHYLRLVFTRSTVLPHLASASDPFRFVPGDVLQNAEFRELGVLPWFSPDQIRIAFFRPLSALTHRLDYALWPDSAPAMHAHSLIWMIALIAVAAALYRRLAGAPWVAGLAILLFAIDDSHALPAGWLANRNALVAATFVTLSVLLYDSWRTRGHRLAAILGPLAFAGALLGGELGTTTLGFLIAHALWLDRAQPRRRMLALLPYFGVLAVWLAVYVAGGYGTRASGLYVDPLRQPLDYAAHVIRTAPVLWFGLFAGVQVSLFPFLERGAALVFSLAATGGCAVIAVALRPLILRDRVARFWATAGLLSTLPALATFPADRLLLIPGLAALGLVSRYVESAFAPEAGAPSSRFARACAIALLVCHGGASAVAFPSQIAFARDFGKIVESGGRTAPEALAGRTLVVIDSPDILVCNHLPFWRGSSGFGELPRRLRCLGVARGTLKVERPDAQSLILRPEGGYLGATMDALYRAPSLRFSVGQRFELSDSVFEILEVTEDFRPLSVKVRFESPLESPEYRFAVWQGKGYVNFALPPVGSSVRIEPVTLLHLLFGV